MGFKQKSECTASQPRESRVVRKQFEQPNVSSFFIRQFFSYDSVKVPFESGVTRRNEPRFDPRFREAHKMSVRMPAGAESPDEPRVNLSRPVGGTARIAELRGVTLIRLFHRRSLA